MTPQEIKPTPTTEQEEAAKQLWIEVVGDSYTEEAVLSIASFLAQREAALQEQVAREKERADRSIESEKYCHEITHTVIPPNCRDCGKKLPPVFLSWLEEKSRAEAAEEKVAGLSAALEGAIAWLSPATSQTRADKIEKLKSSLKSAAPLLAKSRAVERVVATLWDHDSRKIRFDDSVVFGHGYDFFGWERLRQELQHPLGSFAVWKDGDKWSGYSTNDGGMMLWKFADEDSAKAWAYSDIAALAEIEAKR